MRCPGPLGSCSPVCSLVCCAVGCECRASLRAAHSSIRTAAVHSRQGLSTPWARTRPSGRRLFRSQQGLGTLRTHTHPCKRRLFRSRQGLSSLLGAHLSVRTAAGVAWHRFSCCGTLRAVRALRICGTRRPLLLGTCPCSLVRPAACLCGVLVAPRGAPRLVRSGRSRFSSWLSRRRGAFSQPEGLRPRLYCAAARGKRRAAENRAHSACRWPLLRLGRWARCALYPFGSPR